METLDTALKAADTGHLVFSHAAHHRRHPDDQPRSSRSTRRTSTRRSGSLLVDRAAGAWCRCAWCPRADGRGRVPAARGADQHRRRGRQHPRHREGAQHSRPDRRGHGLVRHAVLRPVADEVVQGRASSPTRARCSTRRNPSEFALRVSGVDSASDRTFERDHAATRQGLDDARRASTPLMFKKVLDRQPRRDRPAGHPRLPRAGHRRPWRSTARPTASRCTSASPTTTSASARRRAGSPTSSIPQHHRRRRDHRRRRHPPRLRLPGRERRVRRDLPGLEHHLHRPDRRPDPADGRQGHGAPAGRRRPGCRRCPARPGTIEDAGRGAAPSPRRSASR